MKHLSSNQVANFLPVPDWGRLEVEQISPLVQRVWFYHERDYVYAEGEPVRTVWGFIKGGKVYPPKNSKTAQAKSVCSVTHAFKLSGFTTIIPKTTSLLHLM